MKKTNSAILILTFILILKPGLSTANLPGNGQFPELSNIFNEGRKVFYTELKLRLALHPQVYRLLPESIRKIHDAEKEIPFLYENLVNITYLKESLFFQTLLENGDEKSLRNFNKKYLKLCRETANYFVQSLFTEQDNADKLLLEDNNKGLTRLDLILNSFNYKGGINKSRKNETLLHPSSPEFDLKWSLETARFPQAHKITRGKGIKIAIIDSEPDINHRLLSKANINHDLDFCLPGRKKPPWETESGSFSGSSEHGTLMALIVSAFSPEAEIRIYKVGYAENPHVRRALFGAVAASDHGNLRDHYPDQQ